MYLSLQLAEALVRPRRRSSLARILAATLVHGEWVLLDKTLYNFESILNKFTKYIFLQDYCIEFESHPCLALKKSALAPGTTAAETARIRVNITASVLIMTFGELYHKKRQDQLYDCTITRE